MYGHIIVLEFEESESDITLNEAYDALLEGDFLNYKGESIDIIGDDEEAFQDALSILRDDLSEITTDSGMVNIDLMDMKLDFNDDLRGVYSSFIYDKLNEFIDYDSENIYFDLLKILGVGYYNDVYICDDAFNYYSLKEFIYYHLQEGQNNSYYFKGLLKFRA